MAYESNRDDQLEDLNHVFDDAAEADNAVDDFEKATPPGIFRNHAIDWVSCMNNHGVRRSLMRDENEEPMSSSEFKKLAERKGNNEAWAKTRTGTHVRQSPRV